MSTCSTDGCSTKVIARGLCKTHYKAKRRQDNPAECGGKVWWAERRQRLNAIKLASGCIDCGFREHPAALQFDHRDPNTKELTIARAIGGSWERLLAEIEKCDVRCANCHAIKTARERVGVAVSTAIDRRASG